MSKTKNWLMEQEEVFYDKADSVAGECETVQEFTDKLLPYQDCIAWTLDEHCDFNDLCADLWYEYCAKYSH